MLARYRFPTLNGAFSQVSARNGIRVAVCLTEQAVNLSMQQPT